MVKNLISKMVRSRWILALLSASILLALSGAFGISGHNSQGLDQVQVQEDLRRLDTFRSSRNLDSLEAVVNHDSVKWQQRDRASFVTYMLRACSLLSSYDFGDQSRVARLLTQYAVLVLTSGDLSLQEHVQFVEFLTQDPLVIDQTTWRRLREQKARLWLVAWRRVMGGIDPNFNFDDLPLLNVPAPPNTGLPAGASPEAIKDPKLRADYEKAIAQNSLKTTRYNEQYWLKQNAPSFFKEAERYLVNAYARPPADLSELGRLLSEYIVSEDVRKRIIEAVRKRE